MLANGIKEVAEGIGGALLLLVICGCVCCRKRASSSSNGKQGKNARNQHRDIEMNSIHGTGSNGHGSNGHAVPKQVVPVTPVFANNVAAADGGANPFYVASGTFASLPSATPFDTPPLPFAHFASDTTPTPDDLKVHLPPTATNATEEWEWVG